MSVRCSTPVRSRRRRSPRWRRCLRQQQCPLARTFERPFEHLFERSFEFGSRLSTHWRSGRAAP
eukprot:350084-Chlamydomonas_euryale.AAC.2